MKKMQNFFISALTILAVIGCLNGIINYFFLWENNGQKYSKQYIENSKKIKVKVDEKNFDEKFGHTRYLKYTIFYKGIMGGSSDYMFLDNYTNKYFKIMSFDSSKQNLRGAQDELISSKEVYVIVNNDEINNPAYGTLTNPIHVFSFKGVEKRIEVNTTNDDGTTGWINLEPTQQEYDYNVTQYLTYVMSGREFQEKFEK